MTDKQQREIAALRDGGGQCESALDCGSSTCTKCDCLALTDKGEEAQCFCDISKTGRFGAHCEFYGRASDTTGGGDQRMQLVPSIFRKVASDFEGKMSNSVSISHAYSTNGEGSPELEIPNVPGMPETPTRLQQTAAGSAKSLRGIDLDHPGVNRPLKLPSTQNSPRQRSNVDQTDTSDNGNGQRSPGIESGYNVPWAMLAHPPTAAEEERQAFSMHPSIPESLYQGTPRADAVQQQQSTPLRNAPYTDVVEQTQKQRTSPDIFNAIRNSQTAQNVNHAPDVQVDAGAEAWIHQLVSQAETEKQSDPSHP